MKRISAFTVPLLLTVCSCLSTSGQVPPEQEVSAAELNWFEALSHTDVAALDGSESNDFVLITPPGITTRQDHLTMIRQWQAAKTASSTRYSVSQQKILVYGAVALVTDLLSVVGAGANPVTSPGTYWQTEIWHNEAGAWKLVHLHVTPLARRRM